MLAKDASNSNNEIAAKLFISPETVKRHLSTIYRKMEVNIDIRPSPPPNPSGFCDILLFHRPLFSNPLFRDPILTPKHNFFYNSRGLTTPVPAVYVGSSLFGNGVIGTVRKKKKGYLWKRNKRNHRHCPAAIS